MYQQTLQQNAMAMDGNAIHLDYGAISGRIPVKVMLQFLQANLPHAHDCTQPSFA